MCCQSDNIVSSFTPIKRRLSSKIQENILSLLPISIVFSFQGISYASDHSKEIPFILLPQNSLSLSSFCCMHRPAHLNLAHTTALAEMLSDPKQYPVLRLPMSVQLLPHCSYNISKMWFVRMGLPFG